ncbi:hypothetical protein K466DRAFT_652710 [Polyporus arcularius HHB13444]|uniref:RING-type domain-containing protein n=1 Tax=Polyporus arcularius HHB13444 TaxID=1314778 RepID=A0A5C3PQF4_9APHY|nr:hypothetical protein K466DRAFT_652710 [Polyporus arcularius HHB13444]
MQRAWVTSLTRPISANYVPSSLRHRNSAQLLPPPTQGSNTTRYLCNSCTVLLNSEAARLEHMQWTGHVDFARLTPMNGAPPDAGPVPSSSSPRSPAAASSSSNGAYATRAADAAAASPEVPIVQAQLTGDTTASTLEVRSHKKEIMATAASLAQNARCDKCQLSFPDSDALQTHFNKSGSIHPHCRTCGLGFASITAWVAHKSTCPPPGATPEEVAHESDVTVPSPDSVTPSRRAYNGRSSESVISIVTDTTHSIPQMSQSSTTRGSRSFVDASIRSQAGGIWSTSSRGPASTYDRGRDDGRIASTTASSAGSEGRRRPESSANTHSAASQSIQDWQRRVPQTRSTAVRSMASTPTPPRSSFHCRSCMRDPCVEPVATMCGHIFCHSCILQEIEAKMCCPVCQKTFMVKLQVESG